MTFEDVTPRDVATPPRREALFQEIQDEIQPFSIYRSSTNLTNNDNLAFLNYGLPTMKFSASSNSFSFGGGGGFDGGGAGGSWGDQETTPTEQKETEAEAPETNKYAESVKEKETDAEKEKEKEKDKDEDKDKDKDKDEDKDKDKDKDKDEDKDKDKDKDKAKQEDDAEKKRKEEEEAKRKEEEEKERQKEEQRKEQEKSNAGKTEKWGRREFIINEDGTATHIVRPGDTIWGIAKDAVRAKTGKDNPSNAEVAAEVEQIKKANPQIKNPDRIYPEDKITVPAGTVSEIKQRQAKDEATKEVTSYQAEVKEKDANGQPTRVVEKTADGERVYVKQGDKWVIDKGNGEFEEAPGVSFSTNEHGALIKRDENAQKTTTVYANGNVEIVTGPSPAMISTIYDKKTGRIYREKSPGGDYIEYDGDKTRDVERSKLRVAPNGDVSVS